MSRRIVTVLSVAEVAAILGDYILAQREIEAAPGTAIARDLMAVFEKDANGQIGVAQFRIELTVEEQRESWKG